MKLMRNWKQLTYSTKYVREQKKDYLLMKTIGNGFR